MIDLNNAELFSATTNPDSGAKFYILTKKVAPIQQGFYFVNSGMSAGAEVLWFYCAHPPSPVRTLGLIDFRSGCIRTFPETQFSAASPFVDQESGTVYWAAQGSIWSLHPREDGEPQLVNSLPEDVVRDRTVHRLATHLTVSADGREFLIDAALGLKWIIGSLPLDGGDFHLWHQFDRNYNHAQFSPTDPDLVLFAEENHPDPITGLTFPIIDRMWLIRRNEVPRPVFQHPTRVTHEWWDADGRHVWNVWGNKTWRTNIESGRVEKIECPAPCWHAHNSSDGQHLVFDSNEEFYRGCPSSVYFLNRHTGKHVKIVDNPEMKGITGAQYHIDPHPRFCCSDEFVVFTTTIRGEVDLAIARTSDWTELTS